MQQTEEAALIKVDQLNQLGQRRRKRHGEGWWLTTRSRKCGVAQTGTSRCGGTRSGSAMSAGTKACSSRGSPRKFWRKCVERHWQPPATGNQPATNSHHPQRAQRAQRWAYPTSPPTAATGVALSVSYSKLPLLAVAAPTPAPVSHLQTNQSQEDETTLQPPSVSDMLDMLSA